jgi:hypothetical protein
MLPSWRKVVDAEHRIEDLEKKEYRPQGKMLQCPVRYTVKTMRLAQFDTPDDVLKLDGLTAGNDGALTT